MKYILSIDQGTTGTTVILMDQNINIIAKKNVEFPQIYPKPSWVEHNLDDIWKSVEQATVTVLKESGVNPEEIAGIGITNQRETTCVWDKKTGKPLYNAIVWQCRRTASICEDLKNKGYEEKFKEKTGLVLDPYFSGTKIKWILENVPGIKEKAKKGEVAFGTIDSFLVYKLTGGTVHVTDVSNASRTLIFNIQKLEWDNELVSILNIPESMLPEVKSSSEIYGYTMNLPFLPDGIPVAGIAGDQQAALFGQTCFNEGDAKCTYGTGAFLLTNTGERIVYSKNGLLTTVGWKIDGKTVYALEGSAFIAGAAVQWLRDGLGIIKSAKDIEELARKAGNSQGVVFVPSLTGLGAPYWKPEARGIIIGITRGTTANHLAYATLEGIAFQIVDLIKAMEQDLEGEITEFKVDGGACKNNLLMQIQADLLNKKVIRPVYIETTGMGAAFLAGLSVGVWKSMGELKQILKIDKEFLPQITPKEREEKIKNWKLAISKLL